MQLTSIPFSFSQSSNPIWLSPLAAPDPSATPIFFIVINASFCPQDRAS
jgi:hypothetical protein